MKNKLLNSILVLIFLFLFGFVNSTLAQTTTPTTISPTTAISQQNTEKIRRYNVVFPIAELGNCADFVSCHTYCADAANRDACLAYAKKKGFYNEQEELNKKKLLLIRAKLELRCGETDCKNFCDQKENAEKCDNFIKKYKPELERVKAVITQEMTSKAKLLLGCTTPEACKLLCSQENNKQRCSDFFRQLGLRKEKKPPETDSNRISPFPSRPFQFRLNKTGINSEPTEKPEVKITLTPPIPEETKTSEVTIIPEATETPEVKGAATQQDPIVVFFEKLLNFFK